MKMPAVEGIIERRLLINYRVDPDALSKVLPAPFRPKVVHGCGIGGICLIRLAGLRPRGWPIACGLRSENAAHRIAVEWDVDGRTHEGVYIPRRDSNSRINAAVGGRIFPGHHHRALFTVAESRDVFDVALRSVDADTHVAVRARVATQLPSSSIFNSLTEASEFLRGGSVGYSATRERRWFDGLALQIEDWQVEPLDVEHVASSFFDDRLRFPAGTAVFDNALVMRHIAHSWHALPTLFSCVDAVAA